MLVIITQAHSRAKHAERRRATRHRWAEICTTHAILYVHTCNGSALSLAHKRSGHIPRDYITSSHLLYPAHRIEGAQVV